MAIVAVGTDLAKNVFAVHGVDEDGRVEMTGAQQLRREPRACCRACRLAS